MVKLIREFYRYLKMDKKMRKVTKEMKVAEKDVKAGKKKAAVKVLKKAEKKNAKLADYDEKVRADEIVLRAIVRSSAIVQKSEEEHERSDRFGRCMTLRSWRASLQKLLGKDVE